MQIKEVDVEKVELFSIGQQYSHNALVIHFVNLPNLKNKYIYYKIDDIEEEIPLVSDLFIVSRPLTLHSGEVKAQIIVRDEANETIGLTKNFTMIITPSNYSGIGEDESYPDDPNIKNYFVKIDEKVNSFEELANLVQTKLDKGEFVGAQGPKGEKGAPGEKGDPGDVTEEYRNLASQIAQNASDAQASATNAQTSASNAQKILDDTKTFANQAISELNQIKTDTSLLKEEANTSATNAKASETKAKEYADNLQASTDDISQLKEDKLNKPANPVVGKVLRVKSISDTGEITLETVSGGLPEGGIAGQVLVKKTDAEDDCAWVDPQTATVRTSMDDVALAGAKYILGEQSALSVTMPTDAQTGQEIMVVFSSGQTACTLAVDLDDFDFVPKANFMCKIVFLCVATDTWLVDAKEG